MVLRQLLALVLFGIFPLAGWSANYYVNDNSTSGDMFTTALGNNANSGLTAALPKSSLSDIWNTYGPSGTNVITSGDTIFVDAGNYIATDANLPLSVSGISIIGAGSGLTIFDNNQTSSDANRWATITGDDITISGVYLTGYNYGIGDANVVQITGVTGLIMSDVIVNENLPGGGSSSIVVNGASEVDFIGGGSSCNPGSASVAGGGVNIEGNGNNVSFTNYTFSANTKDYQGGSGLRISGDASTTVDVNDCIFSNNSNASAEGGGAIFIANGASITIDGSCFNGNSSNQTSSVNYGGAITVGRGSTATISNCSFDSNTALSSGNGGALSINTAFGSSGGAGTINVTTCSFSNNSGNDGADIHGRVSFSRPAIYNISECSFSGTSEDIRNDNSATINVSNSGSPSFSGTISLVNSLLPVTAPITNCPASPQPCFTVLPVTFDDFWSRCDNQDHIELNWRTISEINNDKFMIERSQDGSEFLEIATIHGAGTTNSAQEYQFTDRENVLNAYYRLSQIDFDGSISYLKTIFVSSCSTNGIVLSHQLDEAQKQLKITYRTAKTERAVVSIINSTGTIIQQEKFELNKYKNSVQLEIRNGITPGLYLVYVQVANEGYQGKIMVAD
jgi:hypothetical protein